MVSRDGRLHGALLRDRRAPGSSGRLDRWISTLCVGRAAHRVLSALLKTSFGFRTSNRFYGIGRRGAQRTSRAALGEGLRSIPRDSPAAPDAKRTCITKLRRSCPASRWLMCGTDRRRAPRRAPARCRRLGAETPPPLEASSPPRAVEASKTKGGNPRAPSLELRVAKPAKSWRASAATGDVGLAGLHQHSPGVAAAAGAARHLRQHGDSRSGAIDRSRGAPCPRQHRDQRQAAKVVALARSWVPTRMSPSPRGSPRGCATGRLAAARLSRSMRNDAGVRGSAVRAISTRCVAAPHPVQVDVRRSAGRRRGTPSWAPQWMAAQTPVPWHAARSARCTGRSSLPATGPLRKDRRIAFSG